MKIYINETKYEKLLGNNSPIVSIQYGTNPEPEDKFFEYDNIGLWKVMSNDEGKFIFLAVNGEMSGDNYWNMYGGQPIIRTYTYGFDDSGSTFAIDDVTDFNQLESNKLYTIRSLKVNYPPEDNHLYIDKDYIQPGRDGIEIYCKYANGLSYLPPNPITAYAEFKLLGYLADGVYAMINLVDVNGNRYGVDKLIADNYIYLTSASTPPTPPTPPEPEPPTPSDYDGYYIIRYAGPAIDDKEYILSYNSIQNRLDTVEYDRNNILAENIFEIRPVAGGYTFRTKYNDRYLYFTQGEVNAYMQEEEFSPIHIMETSFDSEKHIITGPKVSNSWWTNLGWALCPDKTGRHQGLVSWASTHEAWWFGSEVEADNFKANVWYIDKYEGEIPEPVNHCIGEINAITSMNDEVKEYTFTFKSIDDYINIIGNYTICYIEPDYPYLELYNEYGAFKDSINSGIAVSGTTTGMTIRTAYMSGEEVEVHIRVYCTYQGNSKDIYVGENQLVYTNPTRKYNGLIYWSFYPSRIEEPHKFKITFTNPNIAGTNVAWFDGTTWMNSGDYREFILDQYHSANFRLENEADWNGDWTVTVEDLGIPTIDNPTIANVGTNDGGIWEGSKDQAMASIFNVPEQYIYKFTIPEDGTYKFTLNNPNGDWTDTYMIIYPSWTLNWTWTDDDSGGNGQPMLELSFGAGQEYYIVPCCYNQQARVPMHDFYQLVIEKLS